MPQRATTFASRMLLFPLLLFAFQVFREISSIPDEGAQISEENPYSRRCSHTKRIAFANVPHGATVSNVQCGAPPKGLDRVLSIKDRKQTGITKGKVSPAAITSKVGHDKVRGASSCVSEAISHLRCGLAHFECVTVYCLETQVAFSFKRSMRGNRYVARGEGRWSSTIIKRKK